MNILYRQSPSGDDPGSAFLESLGIKQSTLQHLFTKKDAESISARLHQHAHYEIHIVNSGSLSYEANHTIYPLNAGQFLLLPPQTPHRNRLFQPGTSVLSITFYAPEAPDFLPHITHCVTGQISPAIQECIQLMISEHAQEQHCSSQMIATALAQILIQIWRICGIQGTPVSEHRPSEDSRLALAIRYIQDNIEFAPTVPELSAYCHLSSKQLTRLFLLSKNMTPSEYIRRLRIGRIESLLKDSSLSLHDISEQMHFSSEYYFNTFFKRHAGMPPGEYRKIYQAVR